MVEIASLPYYFRSHTVDFWFSTIISSSIQNTQKNNESIEVFNHITPMKLTYNTQFRRKRKAFFSFPPNSQDYLVK